MCATIVFGVGKSITLFLVHVRHGIDAYSTEQCDLGKGCVREGSVSPGKVKGTGVGGENGCQALIHVVMTLPIIPATCCTCSSTRYMGQSPSDLRLPFFLVLPTAQYLCVCVVCVVCCVCVVCVCSREWGKNLIALP